MVTFLVVILILYFCAKTGILGAVSDTIIDLVETVFNGCFNSIGCLAVIMVFLLIFLTLFA
jgi:hypothetical protein